MSGSIALSSSMRSSLQSLQATSLLMDRTQQRLSTGLKVNSAIDNPVAYFSASAHNQRADILSSLKDTMGEAVQSITQTANGIKSLKSLLESAQGLAESARTANTTDRANIATQFDSIMDQIDSLVSDSKYNGTNFLNGGSLTVNFNEDGTSNLNVTGFSADYASLGLSKATGSFATNAEIDAAGTDITAAIQTLATNSAILSSNLAILNSRREFTSDVINTERTGATNLTAADMNEESSNMLTLQTRQQLGTTALSLANQAQQAVLRLF